MLRLFRIAKENAALRKLCRRQGLILRDRAHEAQLVDMRAGDSAEGGFNIELGGSPVHYIAEYLFQFIRGGDSKASPANYVESVCSPVVEVQHRSGERYVLTVQRVYGLTPNEKERQALNRAEVAERALERLYAERDARQREGEL